MNFKNLAEQNENWIIEQRRYFHAHPELSFEENVKAFLHTDSAS